jgi:hypothetical protein
MVRFPEGHFYDPIPDPTYLEKEQERIWQYPQEYPGIDLNIEGQLEWIKRIEPYFKDFVWTYQPQKDLLYHGNQHGTRLYDSMVLYGLMRYLQPERIIEVGSGFSSALMLDCNKHFFDNTIDLTFIDPNSGWVLETFQYNEDDFTLIKQPAQEVPLETYMELEKNDILFIDSSHVSKCGSEVNFLIHEVLPCLDSGVFIHFHDVFTGFEYPKDWVLDLEWYWSEVYMIRAFLEYNHAFSVVFFGEYMERFYHDLLPFHDDLLELQCFWMQKL